jgi:hypothetical protein
MVKDIEGGTGMNTEIENENERSLAKPCSKCGALLGWISGCGEPGAYDYEPDQQQTACCCTVARDEAIRDVAEALYLLGDLHAESLSEEQGEIVCQMAALSRRLSVMRGDDE